MSDRNKIGVETRQLDGRAAVALFRGDQPLASNAAPPHPIDISTHAGHFAVPKRWTRVTLKKKIVPDNSEMNEMNEKNRHDLYKCMWTVAWHV